MIFRILNIFHKLLLTFPPELSHTLAKNYLLLHQSVLGPLAFKPKEKTPVFLEIKRGEYTLKVKNRVGLAAGFDKNAEVFLALESLGFGFMELGTVTLLPQGGNPKPRLWRIPGSALVNHLGFNSMGASEFKKNILKYKARVEAPLWINIGKNRSTPNEAAHADYGALFEKFKEVADAFVVNLSSPNTPGLVMLQNKKFLKGVVEKAPSGIPLFLKLSPDLTNEELKEILIWIRNEKKVYGVVLTNTSRQLALTLTSHKMGGLSGPPLFERSRECVGMAREILGESKLIVGVGGISSLDQAKKMQAAGADLIEIYTAFIYQGVEFVKTLAQGLS